MVFSEPIFLFGFLPVVLALYALMPPRWRNALLLAASLGFYAVGEHHFVLVMLASITYAYAICLWMDRARTRGSRLWVATVGVAGNLAFLVYFKYANFLIASLNSVLTGAGASPIPNDPIHLPIGVSFFTFQVLSYIVDVYRGEVAVQRRWQDLALYTALFPQLIAGPIVRYSNIEGQLRSRAVTAGDFAEGVERFVIGLAKKMLIANPAGERVDAIFAMPLHELSTPLAWLGMISYSAQIYFDFSAYSDMAVGLARMLGFRFLENFNYPYISRSVSEFWRRWHISLSTWFRDYVYIPLGGNRLSTAITYRNLLVVFVLCGLWHGASWNFLVWGLYHGCFLSLERVAAVRAFLERQRVFSHAYTLLVVLVGWVFFRAESFAQSWAFLRALAGAGTSSAFSPLALHFDSEIALVLAFATIGSTPILHSVRARAFAAGTALPFARAVGYTCLGGAFMLSLLKIAAGSYSPFIYFRF